MRLRRLNADGLHDFESFISQLRNGNEQNTPQYLLESSEYSTELEIDVDVDEQREFVSRYEMGLYLIEIFGDHDMQPFIGDQGFWSWFALAWFGQLCPTINGQRKPSKEYNYVLSRDYNHRPRHAIYMTWQLVHRFGKDAKFMLCKPVATRGEITEQLMARQEVLSSEGVVRLGSRLYFDATTGGFKRGAAARKSAGCIARYMSWLQQQQMTFDIFSTTSDELAELLPDEFDRFLVDTI